jgi:serine/threonine protein kinase/formylglycine-generating enzyme required for sulfatase activity
MESTTDLCRACWHRQAASSTDGSRGRNEADPAEELRSEKLVGRGRYALIEELGRGGMGVVWLAVDNELSKAGDESLVALKFPHVSVRNHPDALAMLRAEVLNSRRLRHPNIVSLYDFCSVLGEPPFICMEYVDGMNLHAMVQASSTRALPWREFLPIASQLCEALDYAHREGIIHRDIKPSNVILNSRRQPKLSDFGVARIFVNANPGSPDLTQPRGTLAYMGPQQLRGEKPSPLDDIYSLGVTLYELLTGTTPFQPCDAESLEYSFEHERLTPIPTRLAHLGIDNQVPRGVAVAICALLAADTRERPRTIRPLLNRFKSIQESSPIPQPSVPPRRAPDDSQTHDEPPPRWPESPRRRISLGWLLPLSLLLIAVGYFVHYRFPQGFESETISEKKKLVKQKQPGDPETPPDGGAVINDPAARPPAAAGAVNQTNSPSRKESLKNDSSNGPLVATKQPSKPRPPEPQFWSAQIITEPPGKTVKESRAIGPEEPATWRTVLQKQYWTNSLGMIFVPVGDVWVSIWETRVRDFREYVLNMGRSAESATGKVSLKNKPDYPVTMVTLEQAKMFCVWLWQRELGERPRRSYRLPTDREWSMAVGLVQENGETPRLRGEQFTNGYPWGDQWPPQRAGNYASLENRILGEKDYADGYPELAPVGSFPPNSQGIYDLGGNVWEWCNEKYDPNAKDSATRGFYVLRGASWREFQRGILRSNYRLPSAPNNTQGNFGFRCVVDFEPGSHSQTR